VRGTPAGYAELVARDGIVEIAYFGLLRGFIGHGLGPRLLHAAVARAWGLGASRVRLSTCTLDAPAARRTYERAGFTVYDVREERVTLPEQPPGPWPGARRPPA
jgi:GNAT superfamily N-acetyltransferase